MGIDLFSAYAGGIVVSTAFMVIINFSATIKPLPNQKVIMVLLPPFWPVMLPFLILSAIVTRRKSVAQFKGKNNDRNYH